MHKKPGWKTRSIAIQIVQINLQRWPILPDCGNTVKFCEQKVDEKCAKNDGEETGKVRAGAEKLQLERW